MATVAPVALPFGDQQPEAKGAPRCSEAIYADVPAGHQACGAVKLLSEEKVVGGAKLMVLAMGKQPSPGDVVGFMDVKGHWAAASGFLQQAIAMGAISGFPDGTFKPDASVTRAQALKITAAAAKMVNPQPEPPGQPAGLGFEDVPAGAWYAPWVGQAARTGLLGDNATFQAIKGNLLNPDMPLTRAEAAQLLGNLVLLRGPIPPPPWPVP